MVTVILSFPQGISFLVNPKQMVDFQTDLYEVGRTEEISIPVAQKMKIQPAKIFKHLTKFVGDAVKKGDRIAAKKAFLSNSEYISEFDGIIKEINHETGELTLKVIKEDRKKIKSFFKGQIIDIGMNQLTVNLPKSVSFALKETPTNFGAKVFYMKNANNTALTETDIKNRVVVTEHINDYLQVKLEALGACGYISLQPLLSVTQLLCVKIKNIDDFSKILDYNFTYCLVSQKDNQVHFYND